MGSLGGSSGCSKARLLSLWGLRDPPAHSSPDPHICTGWARRGKAIVGILGQGRSHNLPRSQRWDGQDGHLESTLLPTCPCSVFGGVNSIRNASLYLGVGVVLTSKFPARCSLSTQLACEGANEIESWRVGCWRGGGGLAERQQRK